MSGNFDNYIKMNQAAKKVGGPVGFISLVLTVGIALGGLVFGLIKK